MYFVAGTDYVLGIRLETRLPNGERDDLLGTGVHSQSKAWVEATKPNASIALIDRYLSLNACSAYGGCKITRLI